MLQIGVTGNLTTDKGSIFEPTLHKENAYKLPLIDA
jgi:hypothetical protein